MGESTAQQAILHEVSEKNKKMENNLPETDSLIINLFFS